MGLTDAIRRFLDHQLVGALSIRHVDGVSHVEP